MHGNPSRDWIAAEFHAEAVAELFGARISGEVATSPRITRGAHSGALEWAPTLITRPSRRLGSMQWGLAWQSYTVHVAEFEGYGVVADCYRRRRCALVLTGYALRVGTIAELRWSGPPTLFAGIYEVVRSRGPSCALVLAPDAPVPMATLDEAERWMMLREHDVIDDAITTRKANAALGDPDAPRPWRSSRV